MTRVMLFAAVMLVLILSYMGFCGESKDANSVKGKDSSAKRPLIQMAILLDTSGSMSGLINQARTEIWAIVNEFIQAKKGSASPEFQLALYEYGKDTLPREKGYIRQILPFTTDLDKVSEELFALTTNGGDEYCGWVIKDAADDLKWSGSDEDLKVIFIAGNEPFTQGPVKYNEACRKAIEKGILVNTIHCGSESEGINGEWKNGAMLADGRFLNIDQNRQVAQIAAPQDAEIANLSAKLNDTYLAYGVGGRQLSERQNMQDKNASSISVQSTVQRAVSKSSIYYENSGWDLVDAVNNKQLDIGKIEKENLPENMRAMSLTERQEFVKAKGNEREAIQSRIKQLDSERKQFVSAEMKKQQADPNTLGSAVIQTITEQAKKRNFVFTRETQKGKNPN